MLFEKYACTSKHNRENAGQVCIERYWIQAQVKVPIKMRKIRLVTGSHVANWKERKTRRSSHESAVKNRRADGLNAPDGSICYMSFGRIKWWRDFQSEVV